MRIIAGTKKGTVVHPPSNLPIRPTTDFCRESLFNILENRFHFNQMKAADLFSGSGMISFELASRECSEIFAVDMNQNCVNFIKSESRKLGFDQLHVVKSDAFKFIRHTEQQFDLVFADPPYKYKFHKELTESIFKLEKLTTGGLFVIEHGDNVSLSALPWFEQKRKYGQSILSFFKHLN